MGIWANSLADLIDETGRMWKRWFGLSINPPVPITFHWLNWSRPTSKASDVVSMTSSTVTSCSPMRFGSTCTWGSLIRSPQIATFATPGTCMMRARIVQ